MTNSTSISEDLAAMKRATPQASALEDGVIYVAFDRFVCCSPRCAGSTALATGLDIDGHRLRPLDDRDLREWATYDDLPPLTCECGRLTAKGGNDA